MRRAGLAVALVGLALPSAAAAAPPVLLPSPGRAPTTIPPLSSQANVTETRWPGRLMGFQRVETGLDASGRAASVAVVQRLRVGGVGDYALGIPAPVVDVRPAAGTDADPGLRSGAILWQGFSPGGEVLAAHAQLLARAAAPYLPLRVSVTGRGVRIANATGLAVQVPVGVGRPGELARILDDVARGGRGDVFAHVDGPIGSRNVRVEAPLKVDGEILSRGGGRVPVHVLLGGGRPLVATFDAPGAAPRIRITARPVLPPALLRLPAGADGRRALDRTVETLARAARTLQYRTFLANPDQRGENRAVYVFRTVSHSRTAPAASKPEGGGGLGPLGVALLVAGAAVVLAGGAVLWARS